MLQLQGVHEKTEFVIGNVIAVMRIRGTNGVDGAKIGGGQREFLIRRIGDEGGEEVIFLVHGKTFTSRRQSFRSKSEVKLGKGRSFFAQAAEFTSGFFEREDRNVLYGSDEGTDVLTMSCSGVRCMDSALELG